MPAKPTFADWEAVADRWKLRRVGRELKGPCPLCGGEDRFHVSEGCAGVLVGCRICIDGKPQGPARFGQVLRLVFGDRFSAKKPKSRQSHQNGLLACPTPLGRKNHMRQLARTQPRSQSQSRAAQFGRRLWEQAKPIPTPSIDGPPTHPVQHWLATRSLLHPWQTVPTAIRWHEREQLLVCGLWPLNAVRRAWPELPTGNPSAVHCVAIDEEGHKRRPDRWEGDDKRTFGPLRDAGAVLAIGDPNETAAPVHCVEGIADALAVYARRSGLVLAAPGRVDTSPIGKASCLGSMGTAP